MARGAPSGSGKEIARLEHGHLIEPERQLSETLVAKTERDRHVAQLTDELVLKSALLEQAEANAAGEKKRVRKTGATLNWQAKLDKGKPMSGAKRELTEMRAELEGEEKSELAAFRLRLADTENGCAKEQSRGRHTYRTRTATDLVNTG